MIDTVLLQVMRDRDTFRKLAGHVPSKALDQATQVILGDYKAYFDEFGHDSIDYDAFMSWFEKFRHPTLNDDQRSTYRQILRNAIKGERDAVTQEVMLKRLHELRLTNTVANLHNMWEEGELPDFADMLGRAIDRFRVDCGLKADTWITTPIGDLLNELSDNSGLKWRLNCLNTHMRPMRPGDFGIIAARPNQGKTTFQLSEATFIAHQLPPDRNIIWLNNEGPGKRVVSRAYQSAIGCTVAEMRAKLDAGTLIEEYVQAMGRVDRLRVFDIHGANCGHVENILDANNPGLVIFDMIDHIHGFGEAARTDIKLEEMYKWARERCVKYECVGWASSQISMEGAGLQFPPMSALKDSKTGKQGACDFLLMIGSTEQEGFAYTRHIGIPKNKLEVEGMPSNPKADVLIRPAHARYVDIEEN